MLAHESATMETGHAEALMPMIARVLTSAGADPMRLDRIVVTHGPGTFTGVRTGIAAARGLALASGAEIVAVSSLVAIAGGVLDDLGGSAAGFDAVLACADARKGQLYVQCVDVAGRVLDEARVLSPADAALLAPEARLSVAGRGAEAIATAAESAGREIVLHRRTGDATYGVHPSVAYMLRVLSSLPPTTRPAPLYLRPPDAKPQSAKSLPWSEP